MTLPTYTNRCRWLILALLFCLLPTTTLAETYQVIRVVDGDTIVVDYHGKKEKVRLLCVNTPESVHPDKKQNVPMGKVASSYAKKRLSGKAVGLEFEGKRLRGRYGRLLAYVFVDGTNFNLELVEQGLSPYYIKYGKSLKYDQQFIGAEKSARQAKLNIWGDEGLSQKYQRSKSKWGQTAKSDDAAIIQNGFIGNKNSMKLHRADCRWVKKMSDKNKVIFERKEEAFDLGYVGCKTCRP